MEDNAINQLEVGSWIISRGLDLRDDLFPHVTGGFRGRMLPVASIEVGCNKKGFILQFISVCTLDDLYSG